LRGPAMSCERAWQRQPDDRQVEQIECDPDDEGGGAGARAVESGDVDALTRAMNKGKVRVRAKGA